MIPDIPDNIRIRLAWLKKKMLRPDVARSLPCWLSQFRKDKVRQPTVQRLSNVREQQTKISIGPILFLHYEESLVSSNLISNLPRFHCAHPKIVPRIFKFHSRRSKIAIVPYFWIFSCREIRDLIILDQNLGLSEPTLWLWTDTSFHCADVMADPTILGEIILTQER